MESNIKYTTHYDPFGVDPSHYRRKISCQNSKRNNRENHKEIRKSKTSKERRLCSLKSIREKITSHGRLLHGADPPQEYERRRKESVAPWGRLNVRDKYLIPRPQTEAKWEIEKTKVQRNDRLLHGADQLTRYISHSQTPDRH